MRESDPQDASDPRVTWHVDADQGWRIALRGDIDVMAGPELDAVLDAVTAADPADILVDLTAVDFLASAGLGFLAPLCNHADPAGHTTTLHNPTPIVRRALTVMGFDHVFTITD